MDIIQEETFGPILPVVEYSDINDAIAWANDCEYGLTSSVYTQNLDNAFKVMRSLKFGETYINRENFEAMQGFHADGVNPESVVRTENMDLRSICKLKWFILRQRNKNKTKDPFLGSLAYLLNLTSN